jgi:heat shock protein HslJ
MTFMACAEGMESEREFMLVLEQVRSWNIFGRQLELFAGDGKRLARFTAQPSK